MSELRELFITLWQTACKDDPARDSCQVIDGNFVFAIAGGPENWEMLAKECAVPSHATETRVGEGIAFSWPSLADSIFAVDGPISARLPNYEARTAQVHMARMVQRSIEMNETAVIEGGTGVGKSLAYAAICMAMDKRAIISTSNKALQMQLYTKDIPFLQGIFPDKTVALVQGKKNYACLYRAYGLNGKFNGPIELEDWVANTKTGNVEEIPFAADWKDLEKVTVNDYCHGQKCPRIDECFYFSAKEKRKTADVLITNHMLLCMNKKYPDAQILPDPDVVVVDEAHKLAGYARNVLGVEFGIKGIEVALGTVGKYGADSDVDLAPFAKELSALSQAGDDKQIGIESSHAFPAGLALAEEMHAEADDIWDDTAWPASALDYEAEADAAALHTMANNVTSASQPTKSGYVRWYDTDSEKISDVPFSTADFVGELAGFAEGVEIGQDGDRVPTIFSSATLAAPDMAHFMRESGIPSAMQMIAQSPFDYVNNSLLYVPNGTSPSPGRDGFLEHVVENMRQLVRASDGGAFLLFTSNKMMNDAAWQLRKEFERNGWPVYVQGELPKLEIARRFREDGRAVLFGTKSFFEGVSIDGDPLRLVVIDKIPFEAPGPLNNAQENAMTERALAAGMSEEGARWYPFKKMRVPKAIIEIKQGKGRAIRTMTDKAVVAILDPRIRSSQYGRGQILPAILNAPLTEKLSAVEKFYMYRKEQPTMPVLPTKVETSTRTKMQAEPLFVETVLVRDEDGELWA
jgi:ATP-dependent DNA helicase DinG